MASNPKYLGEHRSRRSRWSPLVAGGTVRCARGEFCKHAELVDGVWLGGLIAPNEKWDLGHPDAQSSGGPEHSRCNRGAPHTREARRREKYGGPMKHSRVW